MEISTSANFFNGRHLLFYINIAAAHALLDNTMLSAKVIVEKSLAIAASICVYTNTHFTIEELDSEV